MNSANESGIPSAGDNRGIRWIRRSVTAVARGFRRRWSAGTVMALGGCVAWLLSLSAAWAGLSLGAIDVRSMFGDKFHAVIPLKTDSRNELKVMLGTPEDYVKLNLKRSTLIDQLQVRVVTEASGNQYVRVTSDVPLFYPSFNLVVRVEQGGGIVLENYLVAVDFQKSLSIGSKTREAPAPRSETKPPVPSVPPPPEPSPPSDSSQPAEIQMSTAEEMATVPAKTPEPPAKTDTKTEAEAKPMAKKPDPEKKPPPALAPAADEGKAAEKAVYGPVRSGESLFGIARKLNAGKDTEQYSVALWMDNRGQFLGGNIHGLKTGAKLDTAQVDSRMGDLTAAAAGKIIQDQWQEWRAGVSDKKPEGMDAADFAKLEIAGTELGGESSAVLQVVREWKTSWEKADLNAHMGMFAEPDGAEWTKRYHGMRALKAKLMKSHGPVTIKTGSVAVLRRQDHVVVSFDQSYESGQMRSYGRKTLELARVGERWKIVAEKFQPKPAVAPGKQGGPPQEASAFPYVVQVSTHLDLANATRVVNELRRKNYSAYSSPLLPPGGKKIYQVFVDRFADWNLAEETALGLRRVPAAAQAVPMRYPFTLELGVYPREEDAIERVKELRKTGYSSFILRSYDGDTARIKVLVGAYASVRDAETTAVEMQRHNMSPVLVSY